MLALVHALVYSVSRVFQSLVPSPLKQIFSTEAQDQRRRCSNPRFLEIRGVWLRAISFFWFAVLAQQASAVTYTVTAFTDSGNTGELRAAILAANATGGTGNTIAFQCGAPPCTITLTNALPPITSNLTIDGGTFGEIILDGNNLYRVFFVDSGTVTIANLQIQNALARGGDGGGGYPSGAGGGLGAGACLFVNQTTAVVAVQNVYFTNCSAVGGNGGSGLSAPSAGYGGGGGGGMGFAGGIGGNGASGSGGGGGGGGILGSGINAASGVPTGGPGGNGGAGGGGGGGGAAIPSNGGLGGTAYAGNSGGANGDTTGNGGAGGFGGGGGGGANGSSGGVGGFGGGGGSAGTRCNGAGTGGAGAGGAGDPCSGGSGGLLTTTLHGGNGATGNSTTTGASGGGGGAAAGPAIFVVGGSVTILNSTISGSSATGGTGGSGTVSSGGAGTADPTPVFNYQGRINSSNTTGPISGALPSGLPATHFSVSISPNPIVSYTNDTLTVTALDSNNATAAGYNGSVHLSSNNPAPVFPSLPVFSNGVSSASGFNLKKAGSGYTVTATDSIWPYITGTSASVTVNPGALNDLVISAPATAGAGSPFSLTVTAQDLYGNTITNNTDTLHFTSTDASASLPPNSTLSNGVGTFFATLNTPGNQTITASDMGASTQGTSGVIAVGTETPPTIAAAFNPTSVALGSTTTLILTITNPNSVPLNGIAFSNTYPSGLVPNQAGTSSCSGNSVAFGGSSFLLGGVTLAANASCTVSVPMHATSTGPITDTTSSVTSNQSGSRTSAAASATLNVTSAAPTIAVTPTIASGIYGSDEKLAVTVNGSPGITPSGTVTFEVAGASHTVTLANGIATYDVGILPAGSYSVIASYSGDSNYASTVFSQVMPLFTITQVATALSLSASSTTLLPGQNVTLTATLQIPGNGMPTGNIQFYDGSVLLGHSAVNSRIASYSTTSLAPGQTHNLSATYSGDTNFAASSTNAPLSITVSSPSFSVTPVTLPGQSAGQEPTIEPGEPVKFGFQVSPTSGVYPGAVSFTAAGLPSGYTALFSPQNLSADSGQQLVTLTIQPTSTAAKMTFRSLRSGTHPILLSLLLLPLASTRRIWRLRQRSRYLIVSVLLYSGLIVVTGIMGCGGGTGFFAQPPKDYSVAVTVSSGNTQQAVQFTFNLQ